jgi:hypothetical protein
LCGITSVKVIVIHFLNVNFSLWAAPTKLGAFWQNGITL